jgi:hypothetical protein
VDIPRPPANRGRKRLIYGGLALATRVNVRLGRTSVNTVEILGWIEP